MASTQGEFHSEDGQGRLQLGVLYSQLTYWLKASNSFEQALHALETRQNLQGTSQALILLGDLHGHLGENQIAGRYYQQAFYIANQTGTHHETVHALRKLGLTRYWNGALMQAVKLHEQAVRYCEQWDCPHEEALTLGILGYLYCQQQKYAFALACYEAAFEIFDGHPKTKEIVKFQSEMQRGIGHICEVTNHLDRSLHHHSQALRLSQSID